VKLIAGLVLATAVLVGCQMSALNSKGDVESFVQQNMPSGSRRDAVVATLEANGLDHSGQSFPNTLYAMVHPATSSLLKKSFQVRFEFDRDSRLTGYEVFERYTGR